jgi:hypothetical protein
MKPDQPQRLPMTETEKDMLHRLSRCTFLPGSWEKRFVRNLHFTARSKKPTISPKQREWLVEIAYRYRNQIERQTPSSPSGSVAVGEGGQGGEG